jgi:hypothetical protein
LLSWQLLSWQLLSWQLHGEQLHGEARRCPGRISFDLECWDKFR